MEKNIKLKYIDGSVKEYKKGVSIDEVAKDFQKNYKYEIALAKVNNKLKELTSHIYKDCDIDFLDLSSNDGMRVYYRSVAFILIYSVKKLYPNTNVFIKYSIGRGLHCSLTDDTLLNEEKLKNIEEVMRETIKKELPFEKVNVPIDEAIEYFKKTNMNDRVKLFKYRCSSRVNLYKIDGFMNYFYGYMLPNTGYIDKFKLLLDKRDFILQLPNKKEPDKLSEYKELKKLTNVFKETEKWAKIMKVSSVGDLNDVIANGEIGDLIRISEALHEKKISQIADKIHKKKDKVGVVLIAGPSSSGKTTFAKRLSIQLRANGMKPHPISLDDYFVNREFTPLDEYGNYDFEALEAIDVSLFNEHLSSLLKGEEVEIPSFNFTKGAREYKGHKIKMSADDILVIEGIHGLNEKLSATIPKENKYKIFVSAITQLNLDMNNRIPTTDLRVLRRIIRDNRDRGNDAITTINIWPSVRRGEEKNIFPYQEEANIMFNSSLIYELAILKLYAEPLLYNIDKDKLEYAEAKRLYKFLDYFLGVSTEEVPKNSIIREFIGGSCFY